MLGGAESVGNDAQGARRERAGGHATNQRFLGRMQFVLGRRSATVSWPLIASSATSLNSAKNRLRLLMVDYPLSCHGCIIHCGKPLATSVEAHPGRARGCERPRPRSRLDWPQPDHLWIGGAQSFVPSPRCSSMNNARATAPILARGPSCVSPMPQLKRE